MFYYDGNGQQKSSSSVSSGENPSGAPDGTTQGTSQSPNTSALPRDVGQTNNNLFGEGKWIIFKNSAMIDLLVKMQTDVLSREELQQGKGGPDFRTDKGITSTTTWCNHATFIVGRVTDPKLIEAMYNENDPTGTKNTRASDVARNLAKVAKSKESSIREVNPYMAQILANAGVTVAGTKDISTLNGGHVATVAPGYEYDSENGPMMANVGGSDLQGYTRAKDAFRTYKDDKGISVNNYEQGKVHFYVNIESVLKVMAYIEND